MMEHIIYNSDMNNILFSIIIPTYNRAALLKRCLDSVISQTYQNWEAIVVDNYSEDETEDIVRSYKDSRIVYIKNHNYGVIAVSRNKALDVAKGDWIAFLDSDDCWLPNKLSEILPYTNNYDLVYHGYRKNVPRTRWLQFRNEYFYEIKEATVGYVLQRGDPINPSCTCVSKKIVGKSRFSEEKDLIAVEDYDFFLQLLSKNIKVKYLRKILTLYDVSGCSHNEGESERDAIIFKKWKALLKPDDVKEVEFQYLLRFADCKVSVGKFVEAKDAYRKVLKSKLIHKKICAVKGLVKCALKKTRVF